ncbi:AP-1 complex subunit [Musa troglodytarum]|nr:AP-1 complex subunit [Musa troglodytarum]
MVVHKGHITFRPLRSRIIAAVKSSTHQHKFLAGIEISFEVSDLLAGRAIGKRGERNSRSKMIHFVILISRQGKVRLTKCRRKDPRYASLYFCMCIDPDDNELEILEIIHHFVEILDRYFGSVCELDLIFNFHKAYYILDEILIAGELQESSKKAVARLIAAQDSLVETAKEEAGSISNMISQSI